MGRNRYFACIIPALALLSLATGCGFFGEQPVTETERKVFFKAAADGDLTVMKAYIRKKAKIVNTKDEDGRTPLHEAILAQKPEAVDFLLENAATTNHRSKSLGTPLDMAIQRDDKKLVEKLLSRGSKESLPNLAALIDGEGMAMAFDNGAELEEADNNGMTALHWAAAKGDNPNVTMLWEFGADLTALDAKKRTPADVALAAGHQKTQQLLLELATRPRPNLDEEAPPPAKNDGKPAVGRSMDNPHPAGSPVYKNHWRVWTSKDGRTVTAQFIETDFKGTIRLRRGSDKKHFSLNIYKLTEADAKAVIKWEEGELKRRKKAKDWWEKNKGVKTKALPSLQTYKDPQQKPPAKTTQPSKPAAGAAPKTGTKTAPKPAPKPAQ